MLRHLPRCVLAWAMKARRTVAEYLDACKVWRKELDREYVKGFTHAALRQWDVAQTMNLGHKGLYRFTHAQYHGVFDTQHIAAIALLAAAPAANDNP